MTDKPADAANPSWSPETLLVHGGAGGIGTFAIQLAKALGARVFTTAGTAEKQELCLSLGADRAINYREEDFLEVLRDAGGADVILDNMGAKYLGSNVQALATEVDQATSQVNQLKEGVMQISEVTAVISAISEQTNLLALNAAIEAVRAGPRRVGLLATLRQAWGRPAPDA